MKRRRLISSVTFYNQQVGFAKILRYFFLAFIHEREQARTPPADEAAPASVGRVLSRY
jgi:hypothetical protein